jgi:hypothetical protein
MRLTKFLGLTAACVALSTFALSAQAFAQDMESDSTRIVSDPLYLPLQGQIYGETGYTYGSTSQDVFDSTGTRTDTTDIHLNQLSQKILYGLTDDLALNFDWAYDLSRDATRHIVGDGDVTRSASGWTDPEFGLTYRVMDQRDNPLTLDLRADYSPDAFPAKSATPDDEGTVARGGQMADFGATLGHEGPMFTIAAKFDALWLDTRNVLNQSSGDITRTDSLWNYRLGLDTQTRLTDAISFNAGVGHTFTNTGTVFSETTGLEHFSEGGDVTDLTAALNYQFVPNTVVASLEYRHNFYQDTRNLFPTSPTDNTSIRNKDENLVGVTMRYVMP